MDKRKKLNGLPYNLIQQYFSTLFYYDKGYMVDWICNAAREKSVMGVQIDIINKTAIPKDMQIVPLMGYLSLLQETIKKELTKNGFTDDFIVKAIFEIYISPENLNIVIVVATLADKDGNIYRSKPYEAMSFVYFQVFKSIILKRLRIFSVRQINTNQFNKEINYYFKNNNELEELKNKIKNNVNIYENSEIWDIKFQKTITQKYITFLNELENISIETEKTAYNKQ